MNRSQGYYSLAAAAARAPAAVASAVLVATKLIKVPKYRTTRVTSRSPANRERCPAARTWPPLSREQDVDYERPGEGQASGHNYHVGRGGGDEVARGYPPPAAEELDRGHDEGETSEDGQRNAKGPRSSDRTY